MKYYHLMKKLKSDYFKKIILSEQDMQLLNEIDNQFNNKKWENVMNYFVDKNLEREEKFLITKTSFLLSQKIKDQISIEVFPIIEKLRISYTNRSEGFATWIMYTENMKLVGSNLSTKKFLLNKNGIVDDLEPITHNHFLYITKKEKIK